MQPDVKVSSPVGLQQSSSPLEGRSRSGIGSRILGAVGIDISKQKPSVVSQEQAFGEVNPPMGSPEKPMLPTNPSDLDLPLGTQNATSSSENGVSLEPSHAVEDPGIPMTTPERTENPGEIPKEPQVVPVMPSEEGKSTVQSDTRVDEVSSLEVSGGENEKAQISFLEKWLLKHKLPDYVVEDGNIDDAKLAKDAKNPEALRNAGMSQEIVTLVRAIEARGVEIDEMVEAGIEQVYERDQENPQAA